MGIVKDVWDIACDIGEKVFQSFHKRREQGKTEKVLSVMTRNKTLFGGGVAAQTASPLPPRATHRKSTNACLPPPTPALRISSGGV
jgi:hypothetical protein